MKFQSGMFSEWQAPTIVLSLSKESPHIFSKFNPLTDSPLKWTLSTAPSVSLLMVFDCTSGTDEQVAELKVCFELHV